MRAIFRFKFHKKIKFSTFAKTEVFTGCLMVGAFVLALFISNIDVLSKYYVDLKYYPISFGNSLASQTTVIHLVNDGLMTLFFLLIGLELKYHLVLGGYNNRKTLALPIAAAIGGVIVPALIYTYFNFNEPTAKGWAIPIATDTAFMLGILAFFGRHISVKLRAFIISFSLIDDAFALLILAIFYSSVPNIIAYAISIALVIILTVLNQLNVRNPLYYLAIGCALWIAMVKSGLHGSLSGAIVALIIPIKIHDKRNHAFQLLENILKPIVYYFIIPFFIFINSGIRFDTFSRNTLLSNISLGIILGLFIGKQLGIGGFSYLAVKLQLCTLPKNTNWLKFYAICVLSGIGFTLSLFIGELAFTTGKPYYAMRSAVIIAGLLSAVCGILLFIYSTKRKS